MSTNISKKKRDDLLDKIKQIRAFIAAAPQDENTGNLLSYLSELEKDVNGKKYGLVFEEHREEIDEVLDTHTPVLTEDADLFIDHGGQMNFLLEGDNLAALKLLEKTHRGNIDLIFIDPPYNTRNGDFGYDDSRVDLTDTFRHSKWVSFMSERLLVARRLLKNDGVIFIAIDDNEQAALKLLCDQLFGEENFLASIIWQHSIQPKGYSGTFSVHHNYILCYQKTAQFVLNSLPRTDEDNKAYANPDNDPRGRWRSGDVRNALYRPNLIYDIISPSGNVIKPCANGWRWSKETVEEKIKSGEIIFSKDETRIIRKIYLDTLEGRTPETIWFGKDVGTTRSAMSEIKEIFGSSAFGTPKPTSLIERTLRLISRTDATVLDFFAGSGTTGHAVMKLNAEDGGTRRFILCTNNENGICRDVTYERIRRVIDKEDYIRLTYLIPELLSMVDDGKIAFNPAVELSYLDSYQQRAVLDAMALNDCTPSHAQSIRLKKLAQEGLLDDQIVYAVLAETKPNQQEQLKFKREELRKYFPSGYTEEQMRRDIIKGLELLKRQRERNRDAR